MSCASGEAFSDGVSDELVLRCDGALEGASVGVTLKVERRVEARLALLVCEMMLAGWFGKAFKEARWVAGEAYVGERLVLLLDVRHGYESYLVLISTWR
jgi:hypothetical protein